MDFTIKEYKSLLSALIKENYTFQTFNDFLIKEEEKCVILRHDVDLLPGNSLEFAKIQNELGIKGTYYFRAVPESWDVGIIQKINELGHEIGYHYENLTTCHGKMDEAMKDFQYNLAELRKLAPVSTICMHGSPASKFDSKDLWINSKYSDFEIIGEPYFDVDFNSVFYLTDTGRMWDGHKVSVRDKVNTSFENTYHATKDIVDALKKDALPKKIMFTFHPQRWHEPGFLYYQEYVMQNIKNIVKKYFFVSR